MRLWRSESCSLKSFSSNNSKQNLLKLSLSRETVSAGAQQSSTAKHCSSSCRLGLKQPTQKTYSRPMMILSCNIGRGLLLP